MIEALISDIGEIICAKISPAVWGKLETNIILLQDDELESMIDDFIIYPYAVYEEIETPYGIETEMVDCSGLRVDINNQKEVYQKSGLI